MRTLFALLLLILGAMIYVAATEEPKRPEPKQPELQSVGWLDHTGQPIRPTRYRHQYR